MIIQGPHGVSADLTRAPMDRIFAQVENGSTTALSKGMACVWDCTVNDAVSGILQDTFGLRVEQAPAGYTASALYNKAGVAAVDIPAGVAGTRGAVYPLLVYGPCNYALVNTSANGDAVVGGIAVIATDAAGYFSGPENNASVTLLEASHAFGFFRSIIAAAGSATTGHVFVKCLGVTG